MSQFRSLSFHQSASSAASERGASWFLGRVVDVCLGLIVALVPLWFLPVTLDVLELNKQTLLVVLVMVALLAWVGQGLVAQSFSLTRSWMHLVVLFFFVGYAITSWFSVDRYLSLVGNVGQVQWAFVTVAMLVLLYFLVVNRVRATAHVYNLLLWFLLGSLFAGVYGLLQMAGIHLFGGALANMGFNSIGTVNALAVFMVIPMVIAASLTVLGCREEACMLRPGSRIGTAWNVVLWAVLAVGLAVSMIADYWVVWAGLLFGSVLVVALPFVRARRFHRPVLLSVPAVISLVSVALLLFQTPLPIEVPSEVSPSVGHTWSIARQTLRDMPVFGSGPGTWLYDYAQYRSVEANTSPFWNIRFERGRSAVLTLAAMVGVVGMAILAVLLISALVMSATHLVRERDDDAWQAYFTVFAGWMTIVFLAFFYNYNVAHQMVFWFLLALLGAMVAQAGWRWNRSTAPGVMTALSVLFLVLAVGAVAATWLTGQRWVADVRYASAVESFQAGEPIDVSIATLERAVSLNPYNDGYERSLSQAYLVKASGLLSAPLEEGGERKVQDAIASSVMHAERAANLSPANVDNWANLASVYESLTNVVPDADVQAITFYQEALSREPSNPAFMNAIGKLYVLRSDLAAQLMQSPDEAARAEADEQVKAALRDAASWLDRAVTAKSDYAPAHFNLGIVYDRQGRLADAVTKLEQALQASPQDVGIAFQLANLYQRTEAYDKAVALLQQVLVITPDYANARWALAGVYESMGRYDDAIEQVQIVQEANPESPEVAERLQGLMAARDAASAPEPSETTEPLPEDISSNPPEANPLQ